MSAEHKHGHAHHAAHHEPQPEPEPEERHERKAAPTGTVKVANLHRASIGLPPVHHPVKEGEQIKVKYGEQILQPGDNIVSAEHWTAVKDTPVVKNHLEAGFIREGEMPRDEESLKTARESLDGLSDDRALTLVSNSSDKDQLLKWQQTEKRAVVRELINRRFEAIGQSK
jgi:hypothetical protein